MTYLTLSGEKRSYCFPYISTGTQEYYLKTADGRHITFNGPTDAIMAKADVDVRVHKQLDSAGAVQWRVQRENDDVETYDVRGALIQKTDRNGRATSYAYSDVSTPATIALRPGLLISITNDVGRSLKFGYNAAGQMIDMVDPAGQHYQYEYDGPTGPAGANNLTAITYPDGVKKIYHYGETVNTSGANLPNALTGITDENGVRYATYKYDATGRAIAEEHAGSVDAYALNFGSNATTVTDPLGTARTYSFQTILGVVKNTGVSQPGGAGCGPAASNITYDANGNVAARLDFNGQKTTYAYDLTRNLEVSRTEGLGSSGAALLETRTITTAWHPTWRLPVKIEEFAGASATGTPIRRTEYAYDDRANLTQKKLTDPAIGTVRVWTTTYTYSGTVPGLILQKTEDGPRTDVSDVTVWDYYDELDPCLGCRGNVKQVTDALGQVTRYTRYSPHGQMEELIDSQGRTTTLTYDLRQRVTSVTVGNETTTYAYDPVGQLVKLTQPDGSFIAYTYDPAHRLTAVSDGQGNKVSYTLDAAGNRVGEQLTDPSGQLKKSLARAMDALGRVQTVTGLASE